jgi:catechol 2,3-dioxygenase-like lactoylglutathione lyase family enzyme
LTALFLHHGAASGAHNIRMFERYNEKARRTIFFARYEASQFGSPYIEAEFLLLGMLREDKALSMHFIFPHTTEEALRREIEHHQSPGEKISTAIDLPLSNESKHVLAYAAEEAERLGHPFIGTEHLFLGILREHNSFASQLLQRHGINLDEVRNDIASRQPPGPGMGSTVAPAATLGFFQLVLRVANLEASIDFYTKLGFTPVRERGSRSAVLTSGSCNLRLDQNLTAADHLLSFLSADIIPTISRLQSAGAEFEQPPHIESDGSTNARLRDPDGNIITFHSPPHSTPSTPPK